MGKIDLSEVEGAQRTDAGVEAELKALRAAEQEQIDEIRQRIIDGERSDDPIKDLVIVRTHSLDAEVVELYWDLSARVSAHEGEPVVVVAREEERRSFGSPGVREEGGIRTFIGMGVLSSGELHVDVPEGDWSFPTGCHAVAELYGRNLEAKAHSSDLDTGLGRRTLFQKSPYEGMLGKRMGFNTQYEHIRLEFEKPWPPVWLEVHVGTSEIDQWIAQDLDGLSGRQVNTREYNRLAEALRLPSRKMLSRDEFYEAHRTREQAQSD